jgi:CheY-like chemotaxis protein
MALILVVDDNYNHRTLVEHVLTDDGHCVVSAAGGTEAMGHICQWRPDLVIADVAMPRYTGIELIQNIQKHDSTIPIIIYSGS